MHLDKDFRKSGDNDGFIATLRYAHAEYEIELQF